MIYLRPGIKHANSVFKWVREREDNRASVMMPRCSDDRFMAKRRDTVLAAARNRDVVVWGDPETVVLFRTWAVQKGVQFAE